jgi:hypothetical protein
MEIMALLEPEDIYMVGKLTSSILPVENVEYRLFDSAGNPKRLFQENIVGNFLVKRGFVSPLWINTRYAFLLAPLFGSYKEVKKSRNKIVNAGLALSAGLLNGSGSPTVPTYIAVGTGTATVTASDTTLQTETSTSGLSRAAATVSLATTTVSNDTAQWVKSFSVSGTVAITESGVFNAASTGTMLCRQTFSAVNVANGDTFQVTWKIACTSVN